MPCLEGKCRVKEDPELGPLGGERREPPDSKSVPPAAPLELESVRAGGEAGSAAADSQWASPAGLHTRACARLLQRGGGGCIAARCGLCRTGWAGPAAGPAPAAGTERIERTSASWGVSAEGESLRAKIFGGVNDRLGYGAAGRMPWARSGPARGAQQRTAAISRPTRFVLFAACVRAACSAPSESRRLVCK
jgi:hypothetical protein